MMNVFTTANGLPIKTWTEGVPLEHEAMLQVGRLAALPFVHKHVALMPDAHVGIGCTIERAVPHGRTPGEDRGSWGTPPEDVERAWKVNGLMAMSDIFARHPKAWPEKSPVHQLGTLGTGNHFIELCLDEEDFVWVMLHSGSRGLGHRIATYFIELAKKDMQKWFINLPDANLAYFPHETEHYDDYVRAVSFAQDYARDNRQLMLIATIRALRSAGLPTFDLGDTAVNCHHNYVAMEHHFGKNMLVTRKGAVRAREGDLGIIPGSMGAKSYIVSGKGNAQSFHSCSHGAGRAMSRTEARKKFTVADHEAATAGVECRKDEGVLDETPGAYKDIDAVMAAQSDLVDIVHTLRGVLCVKG